MCLPWTMSGVKGTCDYNQVLTLYLIPEVFENFLKVVIESLASNI